jgi:hypothetical protein
MTHLAIKILLIVFSWPLACLAVWAIAVALSFGVKP